VLLGVVGLLLAVGLGIGAGCCRSAVGRSVGLVLLGLLVVRSDVLSGGMA
jgi:hypothetical protein